MQPRNFIFYGLSGAGKGTQARLMIATLKEHTPERASIYIQTGKVLRDWMERDSHSGRRIKDLLEHGRLAPEFLPIAIWGNILVNDFTGEEHLLFDGLPRRALESAILDTALQFYDRGVTDVVVLNVSKEWARERLVERGRADDNEEEIRSRLSWYERDVMPATEYFRGFPQRFRVHDINGEQSIGEVQREILNKVSL